MSSRTTASPTTPFLRTAMAARHCFVVAAVGALAALLPPTGVTAQETHADDLLTVGHYLDMERVGDPRISPDGTQIVFTKSWVNKLEDRFDSEIRVMDSDGARQRFLVEGSNPRWSPDGTRIAYLAPGDAGGQQIHVRWMNAEGSTTQVTRELHTPSNFKWSPDGAYIHFQRLVPHSNPWPIDLPAPPEGANWTPPPRIIDRIHYRYDRIGFLEEGFTHLFRVPSGGGTARQLTSGEWNAGSTFVPGVGNVGYDLTPDGGTLLFDGNMEDADNLYRESHIYALDLASGDIRQLTSERGPWARPTVSPDGRRIAYTGFPWTSQTYKTTELYVMDLDGGNARLVSGDLDRDIGAMHWSDDSGGVFFTAGDRGTQNVHFATIDGEVSQVTEGVHMLSLHLGHARRTGRWHAHLAAGARRRGRIRPEQPRHDHPAHRSQRRRPREQAPRRRGGDLVRVHRRHAGAGLDREAARLRSRSELPPHPAHPRRPPRDVQRRVQLSVSELRG